MTVPPLPADETERLLALDSYAVLDTSPEKAFDDIAELARHVFDAPIVLVSFVAETTQFFKARIGIDVCRTEREGSFCTYTILEHEGMVVLDALEDERFRSSPFVTGETGIRFYAGAPLVTSSGQVLGSFCIADTSPRADFCAEHRDTLARLACLTMDRLELRRLTLSERDGRKPFEAITATSPDAIICADGENRIRSWNAAAERMFGYSAHEVLGQSLGLIVPRPMRAAHEAGLGRAAAGCPAKLIGSLVTVTACRRNGEEFPIELSLSHWTESGEARFGAIIRDITDRRDSEVRLKRAAEFDPLTDLANRTVLSQRMEEARARGSAATLLLFDLDGFKDVNDSLGHAAGDEVLRIVAARIVGDAEGAAGGAGLVSRLGGDEFVVFLPERADPIAATALANRIVAAIERPMEVGEKLIYVGASAGIALAAGPGWDAEDLLGDADLALYRAKAEWKGGVRLFTPDLRQTAHTRMSVSSGMREAWDRREFELYYQPQVDLKTGAVVGAEALIRWNHPERGVVAPAAFLCVLEAGLLAFPVSEWILRTACEQASAWRRAAFPGFRIGVNLFAAQFRAGDLPDIVRRALEDFRLPPAALELEITENIILQSNTRIADDLRRLRDLGVGIAFDDYGTGYASLTMLKDYPVTRLKIDRSFVSGVERSSEDKTIVEAISRLANGFSLEVIAEGIETPEQAELMRRYCAEGQGYLFGRPMPAAQFEATFANGADDRRRAFG